MKKVLFILTMVIVMFVALTNLSLAQTINACYNNKNGALRYVSDASQCTKGETAISWDQTVPQEVYDALCSLGYAFPFCSTYPPYPPPTPTKIVFVSSQTYTGNLGGVGGGDQKCSALAHAAGLSGWYKAWLSTRPRLVYPETSPSNTFTHSTTPYLLLDGTTVADNWNQLVSGILRSSINIDENKNVVVGPVWTSTLPDGTADLEEYDSGCVDFTHSDEGLEAAAGYAGSVNFGWTFGGRYPCNLSARIYCFEQ